MMDTVTAMTKAMTRDMRKLKRSMIGVRIVKEKNKLNRLLSLLDAYGRLQKVYVECRCQLRELAWELEKEFKKVGAIRDRISNDIIIFIYRGVVWSIDEKTLHLMVGLVYPDDTPEDYKRRVISWHEYYEVVK